MFNNAYNFFPFFFLDAFFGPFTFRREISPFRRIPPGQQQAFIRTLSHYRRLDTDFTTHESCRRRRVENSDPLDPPRARPGQHLPPAAGSVVFFSSSSSSYFFFFSFFSLYTRRRFAPGGRRDDQRRRRRSFTDSIERTTRRLPVSDGDLARCTSVADNTRARLITHGRVTINFIFKTNRAIYPYVIYRIFVHKFYTFNYRLTTIRAVVKK